MGFRGFGVWGSGVQVCGLMELVGLGFLSGLSEGNYKSFHKEGLGCRGYFIVSGNMSE